MPRPTPSWLVLLSCGALLFLFCASVRPPTNDLAIFLAQGREMAERGGLADVDEFTHTVEGGRFLNGTWGAQRAFFAVWSVGGYAALQLLLAVAVSATVLITGLAARRAGSGHPAATGFGSMLGVWLVVQNLGMRPQLFALPLFAAYAAIVMTARPTLAAGAACAAIVAVWANLHGSFAIAPVLALLVAAGIAMEAIADPDARARGRISAILESAAPRWAAITAVSAIASLANPYGAEIWGYVAVNTASPSARGLYEWKRTTITDAPGIRLLVASLAIAVAIALRRRLPALRDVPAAFAFVGLALTAIRHVVWTGMVFPIAFARLFAGPAAQGTPERRLHPLFGIGIAAFWAALIVQQSPWLKASVRGLEGDAEIEARLSRDTPARLSAWAAANGVRGRLFNSMEWGGWLVWRLPETRAFVDARIWIFPDDVWKEYMAISGARPGWEDALDHRAVEWAILEKRFHGEHLLPAMRASERWEMRYEDELGAVFRRR